MKSELNHIQIGLENENRPSFRNYLKDLFKDIVSEKDAHKKKGACLINSDYADLLFYIGLKHDVEALKIVRDEVGLIYTYAGFGGLIEAIIEDDNIRSAETKNEMLEVLIDCGWRLPKDSSLNTLSMPDKSDYVRYLSGYGINNGNIEKIVDLK